MDLYSVNNFIVGGVWEITGYNMNIYALLD
jgi:hypothetical protein